MPGERLLEKVKRWEEGRATGDHGHSAPCILAHLRRLLNTRQGNVPIGMDYGVPDFLSMLQSFPDTISAIETALRSTIERYEPRLKDVQVRFLPEGEESLALRFSVVAALARDPQQRISFESSIDLCGKVRIVPDAGPPSSRQSLQGGCR